MYIMSYFSNVTYDPTNTGYNSEYPIYIDGTSASIPVNGTKYYGNVFGNVMCSLIVDGGDTILGGNVIVAQNINLGGGLCILPTYSVVSSNVSTNMRGTPTFVSGNSLSYVSGVTSNIQTQINNVSANVSGNATYFSTLTTGLQSQITSLQTAVTSVSTSSSTTIIMSNVSVYGNTINHGQIDASNLAITGYSAIAESSAIGNDLAVGNDIVNSGSIFCAGNIQCSTIRSKNLVINNTIIQYDTQAQIQNILDIFTRNKLS